MTAISIMWTFTVLQNTVNAIFHDDVISNSVCYFV